MTNVFAINKRVYTVLRLNLKALQPLIWGFPSVAQRDILYYLYSSQCFLDFVFASSLTLTVRTVQYAVSTVISNKKTARSLQFGRVSLQFGRVRRACRVCRFGAGTEHFPRLSTSKIFFIIIYIYILLWATATPILGDPEQEPQSEKSEKRRRRRCFFPFWLHDACSFI